MSEEETETTGEDEVASDEVEPTEDEAPQPESRCEEVNLVHGTVYRCALQDGHEGDHAYVHPSSGELLEEVPEQPAAPDPRIEALTRAVKNYSAAVVKAIGADLDGGTFTLCPCCHVSTPGLYMPHPHSDEEMAQLRSIVGLPSLENYKRDNRYTPCATCDGLGTVLTGSRVPAHMTGRCADCAGTGYISHGETRPTPTPAPALEPAGNGGEVLNGDPPAFDPWGRPYGDPDYYRMPIAGVTT